MRSHAQLNCAEKISNKQFFFLREKATSPVFQFNHISKFYRMIMNQKILLNSSFESIYGMFNIK